MVRGLYAIVDLPHAHGLDAATATRAVLADRLGGGELGAAVVQLRAKDATTAQRVAALRSMAPLCEQAGSRLIVDDDRDAARECGVAVHLGQHDGFETLEDLAEVGVSTHNATQLRAAMKLAPLYVAFGPVRATTSKQNPDPEVGFDGLLRACRLSSRPVVAIGGLQEADVQRVAELGAAAAAVIGALALSTPDAIEESSRSLARAFVTGSTPRTIEQVADQIRSLGRDQLDAIARYADDVGMLIELGLPARFRPLCINGEVHYRPCDVVDLLEAIEGDALQGLVQLRRSSR